MSDIVTVVHDTDPPIHCVVVQRDGTRLDVGKWRADGAPITIDLASGLVEAGAPGYRLSGADAARLRHGEMAVWGEA